MSHFETLFSAVDTLLKRTYTSQGARILLFCVLALFTLFVHGYHVGSFDQSSHLPYLKKYADESLYPGDPFFELRSSHFSYFWLFFIPFYRLGLLEPTLFVLHVLSIFFTFWAIWKLAYSLFRSGTVSLLSVILFSFPHFGFAGFPLFEFSLLNRTFSLPFLILALTWYSENKWLRSAFLLGLLYNIHAVSVHFVLAMIGADMLFRLPKYGVRRIFVSAGLFICGALPVILWKFSTSHAQFTADPYWYKTIADGFLGNIFYTLSMEPYILFATACGVATVFMFWRSLQQRQRDSKTVLLRNFGVGMMAVLIMQLITAYLYPSVFFIQAQIIRVGTFFLLLGYILWLDYLITEYREKRLSRISVFLLLFCFIIIPAPILALLLFFLIRKLFFSWKTANLFMGLVVFLFVISAVFMIQSQLWMPGVYVYPRKTPYYQVQEWAKKNTLHDAVFIVPPYLWSFYDVEWRVISERSTVVTLSELLEAAFEPRYIGTWEKRFDAVAPKARQAFAGNYFQNKDITKEAYTRLSSQEVTRLQKEYGASYFVVEKSSHTYPFPVAYSNTQFIVYKIE